LEEEEEGAKHKAAFRCDIGRYRSFPKDKYSRERGAPSSEWVSTSRYFPRPSSAYKVNYHIIAMHVWFQVAASCYLWMKLKSGLM
jgi:hypothetical protein